MAKAPEVLREWLAKVVARNELAAPPLAVLDDPRARDYEKLDAALALALAGDARAIPTLRRVYDESGFAISNSCLEQGWAALGLALLGDVASIPRIRRCLRINGNGAMADLAVAVLEGHW